jgi:transposase
MARPSRYSPEVRERAVLSGVLWVLRTGAPWHDLPPRYPTVSDLSALPLWQRSGRLELLLQRLAEDL